MKHRIALVLIALLFLALPISTRAESPADRIDMYASDDQVLALQQRLAELGFFDGTADGIYGEKTREAVKTFKDLLLLTKGDDSASASGRFIDSEDLKALYAPDFVGYGKDLQQGDSGGLVKRLQRKLSAAGYLSAEQIDGSYGPSTSAAVSAYRRFNDLPSGTVADKQVQELLYTGKGASLAGDDGKPYTLVQKGDEGDRVTALQTRLIELGFMEGKADGDYGAKTEAAVKSFCNLLALLDGDASASSTGRTIDAYAQYVLDHPSVSIYLKDYRLGDKLEDVERLKRLLIRYNYLDGEIDQTFDENTQNAVRLAQSANGIAVTGMADKATQDLLTSGKAIVSSHSAPRPLVKGDSGKQVRALQGQLVALGLMAAPGDGHYGAETESALSDLKALLLSRGETQWQGIESGAPVVLRERIDEGIDGFVEELKSGSKGEQVRRLQRRLNALAYLSRLSIDGQFGSGTKDALAAFQKNNGLEASGVADHETQTLLFSEKAVEYKTPYKLIVSIADQRVYAYQLGADGSYTQIREMICSTGLGNATPTGVFVDTRPGRRWHYFTEFFCWAQYASQIEGNILFHSVLFYKQNEKSLQWGTLNKLGRKASHGCIRLKVEDAKWIWENCKKGTIVVIQ